MSRKIKISPNGNILSDGLITFNRSGNSSNSKSARLTVPVDIMEAMQITEEDREVTLTYIQREGKLIIEKAKK